MDLAPQPRGVQAQRAAPASLPHKAQAARTRDRASALPARRRSPCAPPRAPGRRAGAPGKAARSPRRRKAGFARAAGPRAPLRWRHSRRSSPTGCVARRLVCAASFCSTPSPATSWIAVRAASARGREPVPDRRLHALGRQQRRAAEPPPADALGYAFVIAQALAVAVLAELEYVSAAKSEA